MDDKKKYMGHSWDSIAFTFVRLFVAFYSITLHSIGIYGIWPMFEMLPHFLFHSTS